MLLKTRYRRNRRRMLSLLLCISAIGVILLGLLVGVNLLVARSAGARSVARLGSHPLKMTPQEMLASILPLHPQYQLAITMGTTAAAQMSCAQSKAAPFCYSPQQVRQAYDIQSLLNKGISGKNRTITIIDAFQDPTVKTDLHLFDKMFGLPDPQLNVLAPFGLTPFNPKDPAQVGFAGEIGLDVEWAHAIAPQATIDLVLANVKVETLQGQLTALLQATGFAVAQNLGSVISQSFGVSESCAGTAFIQQEHKLFQQAARQHQTVFASAGDSGSAAVQCNAQGQPVAIAQGVNYPASDPLVSSVGGTTLIAGTNGQYIGEVAWNESPLGAGATGGGSSRVFALPAFQKQSVRGTHRFVGDLALDGDPLTGVLIVSSQIMPGKTVLIPIGGTSVGSPVAAGLVALFDQAAGTRLGFLNSALYRLSLTQAAGQSFHDIIAGNNAFVFQNMQGQAKIIPGFSAARGWDALSGVGTPDAANLARLLPMFVKANDGAGL
ncbi:MAG TPA: S53 family peptidase [Ktedonobacteraceae bacterium]